MENNFGIFISHYLAGYDSLRLTAKSGFNASDRKYIKDSVRQMIGLELVEESRSELIYQCLLNYNDLPLGTVIKNMYDLVLSMLEDSMAALRDHNLEIAEDVTREMTMLTVSIVRLIHWRKKIFRLSTK